MKNLDFNACYSSYIDCNRIYLDIIEKEKSNPKVYSLQFAEYNHKCHNLKVLCAQRYCEYVNGNGWNLADTYSRDWQQALVRYDLQKLEILVMVKLYCPVAMTQDEMVFISKKIIEPYYNNKVIANHPFFASSILEKIMDVIDDDARLVKTTAMFLSIRQTGEWYQCFFGSFCKLLHKLPISKEIFSSIKIGVTHPYDDIREETVSDINYFLKNGLIDKDFNWIN